MAKQWILIGRQRYKITSIKRYEPEERPDLRSTPYLLYVYFSMTGQSGRVYHAFTTEDERDKVLRQLDEINGI